jgi:hypothetical protein
LSGWQYASIFRNNLQKLKYQTHKNPIVSGFNFIIIKPKDNFKFSDLGGMGTSGVINFWILSISVLGNSSPGYPENSVFDTYWGIKIGIGPGAGGSYTPNSNTSFHDWIPDYSQSFFHWR